MKKLQLVTKILAIVLISAIAFVGVYMQEQNRMENKVKDYDLGMNIEGARIVTLTVSEETEEVTKDSEGNVVEEEDKVEGTDYTTEEVPVNSEESKTTENYNKSKEIIEDRLNKFGVDDYIIKLDEQSGKIIIEMPENSNTLESDNTDHVVSNISEVGKFEIVDSESQEVLMDNNDIKSANVLYNTDTTGTTVYLNIEFNKDGTQKLSDISKEYATVEEDSSSENTTSTETETTDTENTTTDETTEGATEETTQKEITMKIDDTEMITTSFDDPMENGSIQLSMGSATTDEEQLNDNIQSASTISTLLDTGNLPIEYEVYGNEYIASDITSDMIQKVAIVVAIIALLALIVLIIKYKKLGLLASISYIGMIALYLLLIRYANVTLTLEGMTAIVLIGVLNYIFTFKILAKIKEYGTDETKNAIKDSYKDFLIRIIPICILSIVFCFISWTPISSFGMAMFWGLALMVIYNAIVTKSFLKK